MDNHKKKIIVDCERMKYPNTGLYYYCINLINALHQITLKDELIAVYGPKTITKILPNTSQTTQHSLHKFLMPSSIKNANVWHATYQGSNYYPSSKKIPIVLTVHDLNFLQDEKKGKEKKGQYLKALQKKVNRANYITAISNYTKGQLVKYIDIGNKPCSVIYNGCSISELPIINKPSFINSKKFLFSIGTIVEKKNFHALPCLLTGNDMCLVIAGVCQSTKYKNQIIEEARKWQVENRLIFTGAISENDKQWCYKNCEAFVFPSLAEGFGLPVIEAMHFGALTILSPLTSLPEIGAKAAYYFKTFDPDDMRKSFTESWGNFHTNSNAKDAIKKRASEFTWLNAAQDYLEVYRSLY